MATTVGNSSAPVPTFSDASPGMLKPEEQKQMFLKLLVAQLKNQDPTSPMDQKDMMGQMAQMTSVEQLVNMAKTLETMGANATFSQSVSLIGKTVDYVDISGSISRDATVASVSALGGKVELVLGDGTRILPADVVAVR